MLTVTSRAYEYHVALLRMKVQRTCSSTKYKVRSRELAVLVQHVYRTRIQLHKLEYRRKAGFLFYSSSIHFQVLEILSPVFPSKKERKVHSLIWHHASHTDRTPPQPPPSHSRDPSSETKRKENQKSYRNWKKKNSFVMLFVSCQITRPGHGEPQAPLSPPPSKKNPATKNPQVPIVLSVLISSLHEEKNPPPPPPTLVLFSRKTRDGADFLPGFFCRHSSPAPSLKKKHRAVSREQLAESSPTLQP